MRETPQTGFGSACTEHPVNVTNDGFENDEDEMWPLPYKADLQHFLSNLDRSLLWNNILGPAAGLLFRCCAVNWHPPPMHVIDHRGEFRLRSAGAPTVLVQSLQMIHNLCWVCASPECGHSSPGRCRIAALFWTRALLKVAILLQD